MAVSRKFCYRFSIQKITMKYTIFFATLIFSFLNLEAFAQQPTPNKEQTSQGLLTIQPIQHGTLVLERNGKTVYVDPVGGAKAFEGLNKPDLILITHIHGDHLSVETLNTLDTEDATFITPQSVANKLPQKFTSQTTVLGNGEETTHSGIDVKAVAMYNLPPSEDAHHPKGRGNGYVISDPSGKIYISGDTEATPEMRALKNIDIAFVCMNLPYTMDVQQAANAVLDFAPRIVYPYHYRGQDVQTFKKIVNVQNDAIDVRLLNWYEN